MSRTSLLVILSLIIALPVLEACRKKLDVADWDVDALFPLVYGELNFADYTPEEYIQADDQGLLYLVGNQSLLNLGLDTLIGIPDTTIVDGFSLPVNLTVSPGFVFLNYEKNAFYDIKDVELTYAEIRESDIRIFLRNTIDYPVVFEYVILNSSKDGQPFKVTETVLPNDTLGRRYNLNGYALDLRGMDGTKVNTIVSSFKAMIDPSVPNDSVQLKAGDYFGFENTVKNVIPEYVRGYFGNQLIEFNESDSLSVFRQFPFKSLNITDFNVTFNIDNGIGADLRLNIRDLETRNSSQGTVAALQHSIIGSDQLFTRAIDLVSDVRHIRREYGFNAFNSNLDELLEVRPDQFFADLEIEVNPLGNISLGNDFVRYGHNLRVDLDVRVPLIIGLKGLELNDTVDFQFTADQSEGSFDRVNEGTLRCIFSNGYPIDAYIQMYLQDSTGVVLDSLMESAALIAGATEGSNGRVSVGQTSVVEIPVNQQKLDNLELANRLRVKALLNTVGTDTVHIRSNGRIGYQVVTDMNVRVGK